jgi:hypothetical protein
MSKMKVFLFIASAAIFAAVTTHLLSPDTALEEITEGVIHNETGVDVDLSPNQGDKY